MSASDIARASNVARLYKTNTSGAALRNAQPTAFSENVDADVIFILSGAHVGFLPDHVAAPWIAAGKMRRLLASKLSHTVEFQLATPRNRDGSDAMDAFTAALAEQFGGLDDWSGR